MSLTSYQAAPPRVVSMSSDKAKSNRKCYAHEWMHVFNHGRQRGRDRVPCHRRPGPRSLAFLRDGRGLVAQKRQLRVDDFLEFGLRLCAAQKHAIDEESGSASDPVLFTLLHI